MHIPVYIFISKCLSIPLLGNCVKFVYILTYTHSHIYMRLQSQICLDAHKFVCITSSTLHILSWIYVIPRSP